MSLVLLAQSDVFFVCKVMYFLSDCGASIFFRSKGLLYTFTDGVMLIVLRSERYIDDVMLIAHRSEYEKYGSNCGAHKVHSLLRIFVGTIAVQF